MYLDINPAAVGSSGQFFVVPVLPNPSDIGSRKPYAQQVAERNESLSPVDGRHTLQSRDEDDLKRKRLFIAKRLH